MFFSTTDACLSSNYLYCEKKTEYICLALVGLMVGWQAGWQTKYGSVSFFKNSVQIKLFRFLLHLISVECYYSATKAFQSAFLKSSFKVCFEVCIFSCHFLRQLLSARVLNDYTQMGMILVTTCVMKIIFGNDEWRHSLHSKTSLKICIHLDGSIFTLCFTLIRLYWDHLLPLLHRQDKVQKFTNQNRNNFEPLMQNNVI